MANVYVIHEDGRTESMTRVHCTDEDRELQCILEKNPDLLPGDQINPQDWRRWFLIKREMPVPDPTTGAARWNIDFLFVDQDAIPTFVECKRFTDTRARREIIGQMLEYAANAYSLWTKDMIRMFAEETAKERGCTIEDAIHSLQAGNEESPDVFFERLHQNLREGKLRIVFFLEEAPIELRSVVDFLNNQMTRSDVLLVEARQYLHNGTKIVVPTLFGYAEEARLVKRFVPVTTADSRRKWDKDSFFAEARTKVSDVELQAMERLYAQSLSCGCEVSWGTGVNTGSFNIKKRSVCTRSILSVLSNGNLSLNFSWLNGDEAAERARERLKELVEQQVDLRIPPDYAQKWPTYPVSEWAGKVDLLLEVLRQLISEFPERTV